MTQADPMKPWDFRDRIDAKEASRFFGRQVRVTLDRGDKDAFAEGQFVSLNEDGGFVLLINGSKEYGWPCLLIEDVS